MLILGLKLLKHNMSCVLKYVKSIVYKERNTYKRRIREAIEIKLRKPSLNRDNGFKLASIYDTIFAPSGP